MGEHHKPEIKYLQYKLQGHERDDPYTILQKLLEGNKRFVSGSMHKRNWAEEREAVKHGQDPKAVVIECSDSRAVSVIAFDQGLGDLFRIALAGNRIDENAIASITYALSHLGTKVVINLAHSSCGAATAACTYRKRGTMEGNSIDVLLEPLKAVCSAVNFDPDLTAKEHAKFGILELLEDRTIKKLVKEQGVVLVSAYHNLATGEVKLTGGAYYSPKENGGDVLVTDNVESMLADLKARSKSA